MIRWRNLLEVSRQAAPAKTGHAIRNPAIRRQIRVPVAITPVAVLRRLLTTKNWWYLGIYRNCLFRIKQHYKNNFPICSACFGKLGTLLFLLDFPQLCAVVAIAPVFRVATATRFSCMPCPLKPKFGVAKSPGTSSTNLWLRWLRCSWKSQLLFNLNISIMENKNFNRLSLKKETITKLNDDQMKKFVGGLAAGSSSSRSCDNDSCNSQANTGSCGNHSCNCTPAPKSNN